jgi:triacylglycerol esterase/lipase EstA (alpha/beta hydrolase family)
MFISTSAFCGRGEDLTARLGFFMASPQYYLTQDNLSRLRGYRIVFVAGLLSDFYKAVSIRERTVRRGRYFRDQQLWLTAAGIDWSVAAIGSQSTPEENARAVSAAILGSAKPVILIAHSKGGLDALTALLDNPKPARKVAAFYAVQTPFLGSPVADWVNRG